MIRSILPYLRDHREFVISAWLFVELMTLEGAMLEAPKLGTLMAPVFVQERVFLSREVEPGLVRSVTRVEVGACRVVTAFCPRHLKGNRP